MAGLLGPFGRSCARLLCAGLGPLSATWRVRPPTPHRAAAVSERAGPRFLLAPAKDNFHGFSSAGLRICKGTGGGQRCRGRRKDARGRPEGSTWVPEAPWAGCPARWRGAAESGVAVTGSPAPQRQRLPPTSRSLCSFPGAHWWAPPAQRWPSAPTSARVVLEPSEPACTPGPPHDPLRAGLPRPVLRVPPHSPALMSPKRDSTRTGSLFHTGTVLYISWGLS